MSVEVVVPWRGGCPYREAAWEFVQRIYAFEGWKLTVAEHGPGPWSKASAVNPAIEESNANVIVVADADVFCDGLHDAVESVYDGAPWAVPHRRVKRLNQRSTELVLSGELPDRLQLEEPSYTGALTGGMVVIRRDVALDVPMDPRFVGYGGEDRAWGWALCQLVDQPHNGRSNLWHLWHPPQDRPDRNHGSPENEALRRRYISQRDPDRIREIVEEFR